MNKIEAKLRGVKGSSFVAFKVETAPKMNKFATRNGEKIPNPWEGVRKISTVAGRLGVDWRHEVQKADIRRGGAGEIPEIGPGWGVHVTPSIIEHRGETYVQISPRIVRSRYVNRHGTEVARELLEPWMPPRKEGDGNLVRIVRYNVKNIVTARIGGETIKREDC